MTPASGSQSGTAPETAYAKINLALHVRERLPGGYHRIETLFAFCADGDEIAAEEAANLRLTADGPFAEGLPVDSGNLVMRAAERLRDKAAPGCGAAIRLTKNLPVASGIGGGSADAAAALRLLARLWGLDADAPALREIAAELGADVPACLRSLCCRGEGKGDILVRMAGDALEEKPVLLVNPGIAVSTAEVFAAWDGRDCGGLDTPDPLDLDTAWRNDLTGPALAVAPEIGNVLAVLEAQRGAEFVRMSGSGATCFALFGDTAAREAAARAVRAAHPGWWVLESVLR